MQWKYQCLAVVAARLICVKVMLLATRSQVSGESSLRQVLWRRPDFNKGHQEMCRFNVKR